MDKNNQDIIRLYSSSNDKPMTLDEESRAVSVVITTDAPVREYDARTERYMDTVMIPEGIKLPKNGKVPLLDSHNNYSVSKQMGSVVNFSIEGNALTGIARYSKNKLAEDAFNLVREGHLTDYSIGARILKVQYLREDETVEYFGRTYKGEMKIIVESEIKEVSTVPIGADENAKNRGENMDNPNIDPTPVISAPVEPQVARAVEPIVVPQIDLEGVKREAQKLEKERVKQLNNIAREASLGDDVLNRWLDADVSVEVARQEAYNQLIQQRGIKMEGINNIAVTGDVGEKLNRAIESGLMLKLGLSTKEEGAVELRGYTMSEIAREYLRRSNKNFSGSGFEMIGRAMTSSDFPNICGAIANKSLLKGFENQQETYELWCDTTGSVSDFKTNTAVRAGEFDTLEEVAEGEEFKYGSLTEQKEEYTLKTYGKLLNISRQALINDDVSALTDTPMKMGASVKRLIGDLAYAVLTANPTMGDGTALFHASHANIGTSGVIGTTSWGDAELKMGLQKDIRGLQVLNIQPKFLIAPRAVKGAAETFFKSQRFETAQTGTTRENIYFESVTRVYDARLDAASSAIWYALADMQNTVKLFFLNGNKNPFFERQDQFSVDGTTWKVRIDAVAKALSWKGMVRNAGV